MPGPYYGIDTYNWNDEPLGGGAGYWKIIGNQTFNLPQNSLTVHVDTWYQDLALNDVYNIAAPS